MTEHGMYLSSLAFDKKMANFQSPRMEQEAPWTSHEHWKKSRTIFVAEWAIEHRSIMPTNRKPRKFFPS
jgi:hypothetical protein